MTGGATRYGTNGQASSATRVVRRQRIWCEDIRRHLQQHARQEVSAAAQIEANLFLSAERSESQALAKRTCHSARSARWRSPFERTALELGAERVRDVAERPQFGADYFGGVLHDLDGHAIEVLTRAL